MKKLLFILAVLISQFAKSQTIVPRAPASIIPVDQNLIVHRYFKIPVFADTAAANTAITGHDSIGIVFQRYSTGQFYIRDTSTGTHKWTVLASGGSSGVWGSITGTIGSQVDLTAALAAKQNIITTGTAAQYITGTLGLATFPTNVSSFTNDAGYITSVPTILDTMSITGAGVSGNRLKLVNDAVSPGAKYHYGTDGGGTKGWIPDTVYTPGVTSLTALAPLTGGVITTTGSIGADTFVLATKTDLLRYSAGNLDTVLSRGGRITADRTSEFAGKSWTLDSLNNLIIGKANYLCCGGGQTNMLIVGNADTSYNGVAVGDIIIGFGNKNYGAREVMLGNSIYANSASGFDGIFGSADSVYGTNSGYNLVSGTGSVSRNKASIVAGLGLTTNTHNTVTLIDEQAVFGKYNDTSGANMALMYGNGTSNAARSNLFGVDRSGYYTGTGVKNAAGKTFIMPTDGTNDTLATRAFSRSFGGGGGTDSGIAVNNTLLKSVASTTITLKVDTTVVSTKNYVQTYSDTLRIGHTGTSTIWGGYPSPGFDSLYLKSFDGTFFTTKTDSTISVDTSAGVTHLATQGYVGAHGGGGSFSLTNKYVGFGNASNVLTGESRFIYDSVNWSGSLWSRRLSLFGTSAVSPSSFDDATLKIIGKQIYLGDTTQSGPVFLELGPATTSTGKARGFFGWLGTRELNYGYNLNYRNSVHQYYDTTEDLLYSALGPAGFYFQAVGKGHSNYSSYPTQQDVYNLYGKNLGGFIPIKNGGGDYVGSVLSTNRINVWDYSTTNQDQTTGYKAIFDVFSAGLHYSGTSGFSFADSTQLDIGGSPGGVQFTINTKGTNASMYFLQGDATTSHTNMLSFRKSVGGGTPWNVGSGTKNMVFDLNGGVCEEGWVAVSDHPSNFSSFEKYWITQDSAGANATRMRLFESGRLGLGSTTDNKSGRLQITSAGQTQLALHYDASNLTQFIVNSSGNLNIAPTGGQTTLTGSVAGSYRAITALRTLDATDYMVNCTANSFTVTLPTAVGITGRMYIIKNTGTATTITIATTSSQTIDGSAPTAITTLIPLRVMSDGANWITF